MTLHKVKEKELIEYLFQKNQLGHFVSFMISGTYPFPDYDDRLVGLKYALNIEKEWLGLEPGHKPGDIDILIIPFMNGLPEFHKAMAVEVKVPRPTIINPGKNPSSMGVSQVKGLLRDGFPFCGLLHLSAAEPLPEELQVPIPLMENRLDENGNLIRSGKYVNLDYSGFSSVNRQIGRLKQLDIHQAVGFCTKSVGLYVDGNGKRMISISEGHERWPMANPYTSQALISRIKNYFLHNPDCYR